MRNVTDFVVQKRYLVLVLFILVSIASIFISNFVNINYDIAKYLPSDSEVKQGMDIMDQNFEEIKESDLNIMFYEISDNKKEDIKKYLEGVKNVASVEFENTDEYNNDGYTLFRVKVDDYKDSNVSKEVYETIKEEYKDYDIYFSGTIFSANASVLEFKIVVLAVTCAMVILIIMCDSFVEPFLILFAILLAVALNKGSNIIFSNVSFITDAICAVLQMALSMDYSIMLINRYRQERKENDDKEEAMADALYNAFQSISSSSITTIVGLLALVFMSFTIGRDLGFVLAKGVLFSLLSIFLCLPGLLILFDKLIEKTTKKPIHFSLDVLGRFSNYARRALLVVFVILFIGSFFLKGSIVINYTGSDNDEVSKHFKEENQMVLVYANKYESDIKDYCLSLEGDEISKVLCYGNTIGQELKYDEFLPKMEELGEETSIDLDMIKLLYYDYYNRDNLPSISYPNLMNFIDNSILGDEKWGSHVDHDMRKSINQLKNFTTKSLINKKRTSKDTANVINMDKKKIDDLYMLYHAKNINIKIELEKFINYLKAISKDKSLFTDEQRESIDNASIYVDSKTITKSMSSKELASLFNMDEKTVSDILFSYYQTTNNTSSYRISKFIISLYNIKNNTHYLDGVDVSKLISLYPIALNNQNMNATKMDKSGLSAYFNSIDPTLVPTIYAYASLPDSYLMTPIEFLNFTLNNFGAYLPEESIGSLKLVYLVMVDSASPTSPMNKDEMSSLLGIDKKTMNTLYHLIDYTSGKKYTLSPYKFVKYILNSSISKELDKESKDKLNTVYKLMDASLSKKKYSYKEMSELLNIDKDNMKLLYSMYDINKNKVNVKVNLITFVRFLINDVINDSKYADKFDKESIDKLTTLESIMSNSLANKKMSEKELYNELSSLADIDENFIKLVFLYYGSINDYNDSYELTIEEFVTHAYKNVLNHEMFKDFLDEDMKETINDSYQTVMDSKKLLVGKNYSRAIIKTTYPLESEETFEFVKSIKNDLDTDGKEIYLVGDSPMAYELSLSFDDELNFITILTMLFIFIVVAVSFKSIIIPLILVLVIQCAVFVTMGILSLSGEGVYFIALLIVQSILMGATIDYAIVYTSYYLEYRKENDLLTSIIEAYNNSIHTILTSAAILTIVTLIVGNFASNIAAKICLTISKGTICSTLLILFILPGILACFDKIIMRKKD